MTALPNEDLAQDRLHPIGQDRRWRESYYFSFFDPVHRIGGFSSIGKRPASGHSGSINVIWGPDHPTLVASERDSFKSFDDDHDVAGLSYRAEEWFGRWRLRFDGVLNLAGDGIDCDPLVVAPSNGRGRTVRVRYDLTFTPTHAPCIYRQDPRWSELFTGHIDETGTVEGTLEIDDQTYPINGRGGKDHSWGVRNWFAPINWRWIDLVPESGGPAVTLWGATMSPGEWLADGAVFDADGLHRLRDYTESVSVVPGSSGRGKPLPAGMRAEIVTDDRTYSFTASVRRVVPVQFKRVENDRPVIAWNDRALLECRFDDGTIAWANVELAERVDGTK